jgi:AcrR family transcriptional regulator
MSPTHTDSAAPRRRGRPPGGDGSATRDRLLEAALDLFARQGYAATTVRQIADAVGLRDSAIYAHFPGKQAIYDALLAEAGPLAPDAMGIDLAAVAADHPRQAIPALVDRVFASWSGPRSRRFAQVLVRDGSGAGGIGGLDALIEQTRDWLEGPFRHWQEAGLVRSDLAPRQLAWELFAPLQVPRLLHLRPDAGDAEARAVVADHVAFFLTCVITPEGNA